MTIAPDTVTLVTAAESTPPRSLTRRLLANPLGVTAIGILVTVTVLSILAPWIAPYPPNTADLAIAFQPPNPEHWLGTDSAGRDVLSRLLYGGRLTLLGALIALTVAVVIGLVSGLIAGYYGGWFDSVGDLAGSLLMALPAIMIMLAVRVAIGPSLWLIMLVFGVLLSPGIFRLVRSGVRQVKGELYVDAARVSGLSDFRIISRHILYVVRAPVIIQASMIAGIAIAIQSGLEFLGVGDQSTPTWGLMLSEAFRNIYIAPLLIVWPGVMITLVIGSLVLFGNALRDALEDRPVARVRRRDRTARRAPSGVPSTTPEPDVLLSVRDLTVGYPTTDGSVTSVIHDVTFDVKKGRILGLVGESGSGKTQTAWAILGLLPRSAAIRAGAIVLDGDDLLTSQRRHRQALGQRIAYVPQEPMSNLDPFYTVGDQLVAPMRKLLGISRSEAARRAIVLLGRVGIRDPERTMKLYPFEISGGMAQRILIAGAVACDPDLIVADEPTTALDVTVQAEILDLLRDLQRERDLTMVLVTHNLGVVADLCDEVVVMQAGRVVEHGSVVGTLLSPQAPYTRELLASTLDATPARTHRDAEKEASAHG